MSIDKDTRAAAAFWREIKRFSENAKPWDSDVRFYEIKPDEVLDPTKVSQRVYGRRDEFLAVMAAAGADTVDQPLAQKKIALPTEGALLRIKRSTGFETRADLRENFGPVWVTNDESGS